MNRPGTGDWADFNLPLERIYEAAEEWKQALVGIERPWLCWNISHEWCLVQQKLVRSVGWTPVVGFDPQVGPAPLIDGAVGIDFNKHFGFDRMWPHFPVEWAFLFAPRLAFWHSDLLCRPSVMKSLAQTFEALQDGELAAVKERQGFRRMFSFRTRRYWELAACTTREASRSQFEQGCGWWRNIQFHPNCPIDEQAARSRLHYEHGIGIMYWKRHFDGRVIELEQGPLNEGHCTAINNRNYIRISSLATSNHRHAELDRNFDLATVTRMLGITECHTSFSDSMRSRCP